MPVSSLHCVPYFLHHAEVIAITGRSYRLRNRAADSMEAPAAPKPANAPIPAPGSAEQQTVQQQSAAAAKRRGSAGPIARKSQKETESIA